MAAPLVLAAAALALSGCGSGPSPSPGPGPGPAPGWKTSPVEVQGSHLFVDKEPFLARGIAFPNLPDSASVDDWVDVLIRLASLGKNLNLVRLYTYPSCFWETQEGQCFAAFMQAADDLGIYVLAAGTGTTDGYWPISGVTTTQEVYSTGKVLDFGRAVLQRMNYPNTLAVVIGNEFLGKNTWTFASALKAYARDLKAYMKMCNEDNSSPSKGQMRAIPLMYASNDDAGDPLDKQKAEFLFCEDAAASIDIFGLNVERWCNSEIDTAYDTIHDWVKQGNFPGAFVFSEMGCSESNFGPGHPGARDWAQVANFFTKFPNFDGFAAYAYWNAGAPDFNMFDGPTKDATQNQDGQNFFQELDKAVIQRSQEAGSPSTPTCASGMGIPEVAFESHYSDVKPYNQDGFPADQCPKPTAPQSVIV